MLHSKPCVALLTFRLHATRALCVLVFLKASLGVGEGHKISSLSLAKCDSLLLSLCQGGYDWCMSLVREVRLHDVARVVAIRNTLVQAAVPDAAQEAPGHVCNFVIGREGDTLLFALGLLCHFDSGECVSPLVSDVS